MANEAKVAKRVSCYHQAKAKGLKTKTEMKSFEKECKAAAKKAYAKKTLAKKTCGAYCAVICQQH